MAPQKGGGFPLLDHPIAGPSGASARAGIVTGLRRAVPRYMPIVQWLPEYPWLENSAKDIAGGATLGCILVAQSLAHADLCKVNLINGPYSCILPPVVYAVFGTCIHSSIGTGGLISLLTGEKLAAYGDLEQRTHAGAIFTLLVGGLIALMGLFRLSFLVRFLSRPALSGFITASAMLIIVSQFKPMLGLPRGDTGGIGDILLQHPELLKGFNLPTVVLSIVAYGFLASAKALKKAHWLLKYLGDFKELFLLGSSAAFCYKMGKDLNIDVVGNVPSGLPILAWPLQSQGDVDLANEMLPGAFLVAMVTFISSFAGAKKFAMQAGYQVVATNELLALGFANVGGALCGAVPTQIGLSRMGIAYQAGVRSQLGANVYVAVVVAAVVQLFSAYLYFVPRCVLNAIIVNGASHLMEWKQMSWLCSLCWRHGQDHARMYYLDFVVWWVACLCTLTFGAFAGILVAVCTSLLLIVYQVADPPIIPLGYVERRGRWMNLWSHDDARERSGILVFRLEGPLFYANIESLQEWLAEQEVASGAGGQPLQAVVLSAAAMPFVDTTAIQALRQTIENYRQRNISFMVANASGQPARIFKQVLVDLLEAKHFDLTVQECIDHLLQEEGRRSPAAQEQEGLPASWPPARGGAEMGEGELRPLVRMREVYSEVVICYMDGSMKVKGRSAASRVSAAEGPQLARPTSPGA
mmetsp:Transcript_58839/g.182766  ORF Transcript_58839/g.182766 Transcript_58839/m.182766 type:complete len:695 (-) Transcript_58839:114-2198(-)